MTRCGTCGWDLRPRHTNLVDAPNTRLTKSAGLCTICHNQAQHPDTGEPSFDLNHAAAALGYWLNDRRNRGVPQEGYTI